jgi:hypothetical protein
MTKRKQPGEESLTEEKFYDDEWGHATALLRASGGDLTRAQRVLELAHDAMERLAKIPDEQGKPKKK